LVATRRDLLPLSAAPATALDAYAGDCLGCRRPTCHRGHWHRVEVRPYLVRAARAGICESCARAQRRADRARRRGVDASATALRGYRGVTYTPEQLAELRALVACVGCGAVPYDHGDHNPHRRVTGVRCDHAAGCLTARWREGLDDPLAATMRAVAYDRMAAAPGLEHLLWAYARGTAGTG
jgi:hypothetical protein